MTEQKEKIEIVGVIDSEPPRKLYAPNLFVGRETEMEAILSKVESGPSEGVRRSVVEITGGKGIGKSWFACEMARRLANDPKVAVALVDFSGIVTKPEMETVYDLFAQSNEVFRLAKPKRTSMSVGFDPDRANQFVNRVREVGLEKKPVLIFDTTNLADEKVLGFIGESMIYSLVQPASPPVLFVFAGRNRLFWQDFDVRRRVDPLVLPALSGEEAKGQILKELGRKTIDDRVVDLVSHASAGHPELVSKILWWLKHDQGAESWDRKEIESGWDYVLDRTREVVDSNFLLGLNKETYELIWKACVLRSFHTAQLRYLAGLDDKRALKRPEGDFLDNIQQGIDISIIHWGKSETGERYMLDDTLRTIMVRNLGYRDPDGFQRLQRAAIYLYTGWIEDYPDNVRGYREEIKYHLALLREFERTGRVAI